jgi:glycosyltransferase involved in cell wall biosynthesis
VTPSTTRIRVCQCVDDLDAAGAQQVVRFLAEKLDRRKFQSIVYTFRHGPLVDPIQESGVQVRVLPRFVPRIDLGVVRRIRRALMVDRVEVLHMHLFGATLHGTLAAMPVTGMARVVSLHSDREDNLLQRLAYPLLFSASHSVVGVSRDASRKMVGRYPELRAKLVTIPNGINTSLYQIRVDRQRMLRGLALPRNARVVGTVGRLSREKGHDVLLDAFRILKGEVPEAFLVIVGEGDLRDFLMKRATQLGIEASVRYLGARRDVPELLKVMDVFALSSLWEGLPLVLLEAMAAGVPVVSSAVGGVPEAVGHEREGLLVPPSDPEALAAALVRILTDSTLAEAMRRAASTMVQTNYRIEDMLARHETLYTSLRSTGVSQMAKPHTAAATLPEDGRSRSFGS